MTYTKAPYNFVPLSDFVFCPDWADKVSHDLPLEDGVCGSIDFEIETKTPLLVGGDRHESTKTKPELVKMFVTPDGQTSYAIPGSSLRGMIRNVLEIASFGKMNRVNEERHKVKANGAKHISQHTVPSMTKRVSKDHFDKDKRDMAELLFGYIDERPGEKSLKSRVHFGLAKMTLLGDGGVETSQATVQGPPRATFYPNTLEQDSIKPNHQGALPELNTLLSGDPRIRGRKRYPRKTTVTFPTPPNDNKDVQVQLEYLPEGTGFLFRLHFHNINEVEFGALLWCMTLTGSETLAHAIGNGRSFGMGSVQLRPVSHKIVKNYKNSNFSASTKAFTKTISEAIRLSSIPALKLEDTSHYKELVAMSNPELGERLNDELKYMSLKEHGNAKSNHWRLRSFFTMLHHHQRQL